MIPLINYYIFEFIRRFLLFVLPAGFTKIRYYGLLSSRNKAAKLKSCRELLSVSNIEPDYFESDSRQELLIALTCMDARICPACGKGRFVRCRIIDSYKYAPT